MAQQDQGQQMPDPAKNTSEYLAALQAPLVATTRHASSLPGPSDLAFHRSIEKDIGTGLDASADDVHDLIRSITSWTKGKSKASTTDNRDDDDDDQQQQVYRGISDVVDGLLERADTRMDEYLGKVAPRTTTSANTKLTASMPTTSSSTLPKTGKLPSEITNAQIDPPQRKFTIKPDNSATSQWDRPLAMGKPNAKVPITWSAFSDDDSISHQPPAIRQGMYCAEGDPRHNPYYYEIFNTQPPAFVYQPPSEQQLTPPPPLDAAVPQGVSGVPLTWIDTRSGIEQLAAHLQEDRVQEIAIDLEAHAYRSYQGLACLMQLSTRWGDYIIDLLSDQVRTSIEMLNTSFTHPEKVKILHGAEHDVLWLQRDCGLYLVNLFDTYHATNVLPFPAHGLAYLLTKYYDFEADKRYQLADWRIRPLPNEMLYYARSDTHSLIYIYHRLRSELLTAGGKIAMDEVFKRSQITAARRYAKEEWDHDGWTREGWRSLWKRMGHTDANGTEQRMETSQMTRTERLLRRLHRWRDDVARAEDESPRYILSAQNLLNLASRAPMSKSEALAVFSPGIPPVRKRAGEVARIVKEEILAWEQDEKQKQDAQKAALAGTNDEKGEDVGVAAGQEDVGVVATLPQSAATDAGQPIKSLAPASTSSPVNASLWASQGHNISVPRSQQSALFGSQSITSTNGAARPAVSNLQTSLMSSLAKLLGSAPRPEASNGNNNDTAMTNDEEGQDSDAAAVEMSLSVQRGPEGWVPATTSTHASGSSASTAVAADESSDSSAEPEDEVVSVKRSRKDKTKKPKWSREQKRKAREDSQQQQLSRESVEDTPSPSKKTKTSPAADTPVKPFDYSTQQSILDNPASVAPKREKTNRKQKEKRRGAKVVPDANDPSRFADRPAPRDRTEIKGAGRSFTFK
ncbi:unnamed protein product [Sympodiomycopsis kandeliae]